MKKSLFQSVILSVTCLLLTSSLLAQSPQGIPYQAVMRNADGTVMASSAVSLTFMIHDGTANGTVLYQESHSLTSNAQGLVSCVVGNGVESQGSFSNINWGSGGKFLHVMMNGNDLGTQQMLSVPYALNADRVGVRVSATGDTLVVGGNFVIVPGISAANFPPAILGCTDNAACNYNSAATQNDNSCLFTGATCDDGNANTINDVINNNCQCSGEAIVNGCTDGAACNFLANANQDDGSCLYLNATCNDNNANTMNDVINANCQCAGVLMVSGCTNPQACNYNAAANVDNGSCLIQGSACNDSNANTTNDVINGSCVCAGTAVGNGTYVPGNGATDIDGNTYTSIIINGQEWMQQNLAVTKYRNGDPIPTGLSDATWEGTVSGAYAIYNNDAVNNTLYGKLYNWYAVNDSRGVCPTGWHVPSDAEWSTFINYLDPNANGGDTWTNVAGGKLKSTTGWDSPNEGATNESGFTGLPGGSRGGIGTYNEIGANGYWWSSSENNSNLAWFRVLLYHNSNVTRFGTIKRLGYSVRCVRD
jgi:uncharacterized protein (TIGR02145 family)